MSSRFRQLNYVEAATVTVLRLILISGRLCEMLRAEEHGDRRDRGRKNRAQVFAAKAEPAGEDGPRNLAPQEALTLLRCQGT